MLRKYAFIALFIGAPTLLLADEYVIDTKGAHAFVQFKVKHLGYSWLWGRFDRFEGSFTYDEANPANNRVNVRVDTTSVNSNHADRDKHLRSDDFLDVEKYPEATFKSTGYEKTGDDTALVKGDLTLHGVTRPIVIEVTETGAGNDPWGGYRRGFTGKVTLKFKDFGIDYNLGEASTEFHLILDVEGKRQ